MNIREIFEQKDVVFSFEVFPPKKSSSIDVIYKTLEELKELKPDFISVTYGAGGTSAENRTLELASLIKNKYNIEPMTHLTCIGSKKEEIRKVLQALNENGIKNILALRGDIDESNIIKGDFNYANELIEFIKKFGNFNVSAACYPEGHLECESLSRDLLNLKEKVDAGATHLISQLFFDNDLFYNFLDKSESKNIRNIPIQAGIMPVVNKKQIERIISLCGASFPKKFMKIVEKYEHDKDALRDAGIAYAIEQIIDLVSNDVDGIHLYTMNNPYVAKRICSNIGSIVNSINNKKNV
ncbi:methylenetetrahydrofolate reductase [NAD(P)H] [Clostridium tarantellae]|uniref:Methylenetetrahydrofolate reductase n=1 Tax=Clostridium tarantellae TaxID=39493 RepID=A0A6I1MJ36_9CLOT|nr:methylenetetrahydrofolate reductase [NAD(P)H] [Clostridium tarantellae]MPQ43120.1 methylenetetrahydrofolate reductase [NAD(P)H] [Clostridium tarantellae]